MDKSADTNLPWWLPPWLTPGVGAPQQLNQPILPGWSLISVNEQNSSDPETEREIVGSESYGRQIGRLTEAVLALVEELPQGARKHPAFTALEELHDRVERIKCDAAERRIRQVGEDLAALKAARPEVYAERVAALRALLSE